MIILKLMTLLGRLYLVLWCGNYGMILIGTILYYWMQILADVEIFIDRGVLLGVELGKGCYLELMMLRN